MIADSFVLGRRPPGLPSRLPLAPADHVDSSPIATDEGVIVYVEATGEM